MSDKQKEKLKLNNEFMPERRPDSRYLFYMYVIFLLVIHLFLGIIYLAADNTAMTLLNLFSIAVYITGLVMIRLKAFRASFYLIVAEVNLFVLAAVILVGDASHYSLYSISLTPSICLYFYYQKIISGRNKNMLIVLSFILSNVFYIAAQVISGINEPLLSLPPVLQQLIAHFNYFILMLAVGTGSIILLFIAILNSKKLEHALEETGYAAQHDYLTGLKNRKSMENFIGRLYTSNREYSLIMGDIDKFKEVNDTYGHDCGDYILKIISRLIKENVTKEDRTYRYGGEEIIAILPEVSKADACRIAELIRSRIAAYEFEYNNRSIHITMSFGVSASEGRSFTEVEREADACLYYGKASGRNRVVSSEMIKNH